MAFPCLTLVYPRLPVRALFWRNCWTLADQWLKKSHSQPPGMYPKPCKFWDIYLISTLCRISEPSRLWAYTSLYFQINKCCQGNTMENLHFKEWTLKQIELYREYKLIMHKFSQIKFGTLRKCSWCTFMWGALVWKGSGDLWYQLGVTQWFFVSSKRHILIFR